LTAAVPAMGGLPAESVREDWTVPLLALMMFLAPALGVPSESMLQDTLKSIVVAFSALGAALLFFQQQREGRDALRWHAVVWLPLLLAAYALGSMAWSHTFLAGVEAIRWFVFALLLWLGLNTFSRERVPMLAWGIHAGALVASLWTVLQFWVDFKLFPQGPNPGSTFINRNFFAEFTVCTLPFGAWLLVRARASAFVALLSASLGVIVVAIMMTGTRAALIALWLQLLIVLPLAAWRLRTPLAAREWGLGTRIVAVAAFLLTVGALGAIPTGNPKILEEARIEGRGTTALERGLRRTESIKPGDTSLGVRMLMWKSTARMIQAHPLAGVGAGAWEVHAPLFQEPGAQLETDYYAHNEYLQLAAEYGVVGWIFLIALAAWLLRGAWRTWRSAGEEAPVRAVALTSLLCLMIVSNVGFPWRMAATGALFALCLAILAASDARLGIAGRAAVQRLRWSRPISDMATGATVACLALAIYITRETARCEWDLVRAARLALTISASGDYDNPKWNEDKRELLARTREGVRINPHYRKITPIIADELAKWGDWANALWVWDSVLQSRPYVVAIITNVARAHISLGNLAQANVYLARAKALQPHAPAVRSLEAIIVARSGKEDQAKALARQAIADKAYDYDLVNTAFALALRSKDWDFARQAADILIREWPPTRVRVYLELGLMYHQELKDPAKALENFKLALASTPQAQLGSVITQIPQPYLSQLVQISSSKK
jgi:O-antigen ligase